MKDSVDSLEVQFPDQKDLDHIETNSRVFNRTFEYDGGQVKTIRIEVVE